MKKKSYVSDLILIISLLTSCAILMLLFYTDKTDGSKAVVYYENEVVAEYPLSVDGEYALNGGTNILRIEDGRAYVKEATCPDGWCMNQGKIYLSGERITCLPNRVMIMIEEGEQ